MSTIRHLRRRREPVDGTERLVQENESVYIVITQRHRLESSSKIPLIEVQVGTYLGEDDIIRIDDPYARVPDEIRECKGAEGPAILRIRKPKVARPARVGRKVAACRGR